MSRNSSKSLQTLKKELDKVNDEGGELKSIINGLNTLKPIQRIAIYLHEKNCVDGNDYRSDSKCKWNYSENWDGEVEKRYLAIAQKMLDRLVGEDKVYEFIDDVNDCKCQY